MALGFRFIPQSQGAAPQTLNWFVSDNQPPKNTASLTVLLMTSVAPWVPQPSFNAPTPSILGWLQPFAQKTATRPFYDLNPGWVPFVPVQVQPVIVPISPFPVTQFPARRFTNQVMAY